MGLNDHYIETKDESDNTKTPPEEGWEGNIMASSSGNVEQRNIDDILYRIFTRRRNRFWLDKLLDNNQYWIHEIEK